MGDSIQSAFGPDSLSDEEFDLSASSDGGPSWALSQTTDADLSILFLQCSGWCTIRLPIAKIEGHTITAKGGDAVQLDGWIDGFLRRKERTGIYTLRGTRVECPNRLHETEALIAIRVEKGSVRCVDRRSEVRKRYESPPPAAAWVAGHDARHQARVLDISSAGMGIQTPVPLRTGLRVCIFFRHWLDESEFVYQALAQVVRAGISPTTGQRQYGLRIVMAASNRDY